jgi:lipopolysaccharide export system permease protein
MKILSNYLLKEVTVNVILIMVALIAMLSFFDLLQELDNLGKGTYTFGKIVLFVVLSMPGHVYDVMPVAVLVGCMLSLGQLARHSELVIFRVSGISVIKMTILLLRVGLLFTLLTFFVGELITPISEKMAQRMRIKETDSVIAQDFRSGLWVKDGRNFVNVENVLPDTTLLNIHIYEFDEKSRLIQTSNAKSARFESDDWQLNDVTKTFFNEDKIRVEQLSSTTWHSLIRPELLNILLVLPEKMSAWNLYSYIQHLTVNKQKTTRYEIAIWAKMVYPLACLVMVILALPFSFIQQRDTGVSTKIFFGMMLGVTYQILNRVFVHLGLLNDWPPLFSAIMPTVLFLMVGIGMLFVAERS